MTRAELLKIVISRAHANGFEFRRWYTSRLGVPWINAEASIALLDAQRRYYALLFSHDFASTFWKPGEDITFQVPGNSFQRRLADGTIGTVTRKPFTKRSARPDAWRYHLSQMALSEEPLRYIRKYLNVEDELEDSPPEVDLAPLEGAPPRRKKAAANAPRKSRSKPIAHPIPTGLPDFLKRPYPGRDKL